ncbi:sigma-70 family RNA polymerase sigma factor [Lentisphaera profundi]|uniref:Sigma-70 family RNA polymerase sigma factor n=1 Tax=Lentisphaera profundi TaxID=1658616 RepID=A0ABY7VPT0_9BACT|nr:sigma-70 family RNA polymerase sigma factor [Lentisphaera profundi]WDE95213.1 sigma-70 family RNA polymerase sigma factor [Lentisphaera profundi]
MSDWITNATLLQRVKNQYDDKSWDEFNEYYRPYIYMIVKGLNMRHHDAQELTQLILIKTWKNLPTFEYDPDKGCFRSWLRRVAVNSVRNYVVTKAYKQVSLDALEEQEGHVYSEHEFTESEIEKVADREWENYIFGMAWENVKDKFNDNIQNVYEQLLQDLDPEAIAENIGIKRNTVYIYRKRVNEKLFKEIRRLNYELG